VRCQRKLTLMVGKKERSTEPPQCVDDWEGSARDRLLEDELRDAVRPAADDPVREVT
jgi:hypothetical protein